MRDEVDGIFANLLDSFILFSFEGSVYQAHFSAIDRVRADLLDDTCVLKQECILLQSVFPPQVALGRCSCDMGMHIVVFSDAFFSFEGTLP